MTTQRRRRRDHEGIEGLIVSLADLRYTPPEIHNQLTKRFGAANVPTLRTIQRHVRDLTPHSESEAWSLANVSSERDRLALEVLKEVVNETNGRRKHLTRLEAEWVIKLRTVAPGLTAWNAWLYAGEYINREENGADAEDLDLAVAFAPPASEETDGDFLSRITIHAAAHFQSWPDRRFYIQANRPIDHELIARVRTYLLFSYGRGGSIRFLPGIPDALQLKDREEELMHEVVAKAARGSDQADVAAFMASDWLEGDSNARTRSQEG